MNKQLSLIVQRNCVSVSAHTAGSAPFRTLSVINFNHINDFLWLVRSSTNYHQMAAHEGDQMLVSSDWSVGLRFWRCYPIPTSIPVFSQTPNIIQCASIWITLGTVLVLLCLLSTSINDHHALSWALFTNCSTVIYSRWRTDLVLKFILLPLERAFVDVKQPNIVLGTITWISPKHNQIRFVKNHGVSISLTWCHVLVCYFNYFPSWSDFMKFVTLF